MALNTKKGKWILYSLVALFFISVNYAFTSWQNLQSRQIVVYHSYKNSLIDFIDAGEVSSFSNTAMNQQQIDFAAKNNRAILAAKLNNQNTLEQSTIKTDQLLYKDSYFQFYDKKILVLDADIQQGATVDFLVLRNNAKVDLFTLKDKIDFKTLIMDGSNSTYKSQAWIKDCKSIGIDYWDTASQGAFIFTF